MMGSGMMGGMGFWMFFTMIFLVLILVGLIFAIVWVVQRAVGINPQKVDETAIETLKKRYARGEITKEEFENIKKDIV